MRSTKLTKVEGGSGFSREHGAAMVEFALVFMLLFTVVTLVAQGGFFFSTWLAATNGAREGARFAAPCLNRTVEPCTAAEVEAVVNDRTSGFLDQTAPSSPAPCNVATQGYRVCVDTSDTHAVSVRVWATSPSVAPVVGALTVYGESTMRLENQP